MASEVRSASSPAQDKGEYPKEYRFKVSTDNVRSFKDPHNPELQIHHVYVRVRDFAHGKLPDDVNPRSHEDPSGCVPEAIQTTLETTPQWFHLLNRGILVLAQKCWYDNRTQSLHIVINSPDEGGVADGATTDRVIQRAKDEVSLADFTTLAEEEIPAHLKEAFAHLEIVSGTIGDMLVPLTRARNTSNQVKEFALENLGGGFDWLKTMIEESEFRGRVRYRENDREPVDIRTILGLLTLFHPKWDEEGKEPVVVFSSKGMVLDFYQKSEWKQGYEALRPVVLDILRLAEHIHLEFPAQYNKAKADAGRNGRLGGRKEVRYYEKHPFTLPLSREQTKYVIPDGWLYPVLASFRMLLIFGKNGKTKWVTEPKTFFDERGYELVGDVADQSESLGRNPAATGKSRPLWNNLRKSMELHRMKIDRSAE